MTTPMPLLGFTQVGELLLVDLRLADNIERDSKLGRLLLEMTESGICGTIENTLVIDFLAADKVTRKYILDRRNWPRT